MVRPPGTPRYEFRKRGKFGCHVFDGVVHAGIGPLVHRIIQADMSDMARRLSAIPVTTQAASAALVHEQAATQAKRKSRPVKNPMRRGTMLHARIEKAVENGTLQKAGGATGIVRKALARAGWTIEKAEEPCNWSSIKVGTRIDLVCRNVQGQRALFNLKTTQSNLSRLMSPQVRFAGAYAALPGSVLNAYHMQVLGEVVLWKKCFPTRPVNAYGVVVSTNDQRAFVIETPAELRALEGQMERDMATFSRA
jgi:hypothetical protein